MLNSERARQMRVLYIYCWTAIAMGDPPRKIVRRYLRWFADRRARVDYHALYHMNVATAAQRTAFLEKIRAAMARPA